MTVVAAELAVLMNGLEALFGAEAIVCLALAHKLLCVGFINILAFALYIRAVFAADVRSFVMLQTDLLQCIIYNVCCTFYIALLICVFNSEHKRAVLGLRHQILVQRRSEVSDVHETGGARRKACANH